MKVVRLHWAALARPETLAERFALWCRRGWRRNRGVLSGLSWWSYEP